MTIPENAKTPLIVVGLIFLAGVFALGFALLTVPAFGQPVVVSDDYYQERCLDPQFSPAPPNCVNIRPRSAPLDCSLPDFSPRHPYCTPQRRNLDAIAKCDGFSPAPAGCPD